MQEPEVFQQQMHSSVTENSPMPNSEEHMAQYPLVCHLKDHIDWIIEGWERERPDLDVAPIAVINRMERLQGYLRAEVASIFERFGLSGPSFAVIATLRRAGKPYQLSQRALMDALQLTGGT